MATNSVLRPSVLSRRSGQFQSRVVTPPNRKIKHKPKECVTVCLALWVLVALTGCALELCDHTSHGVLLEIGTAVHFREGNQSLFQPFPSELVFQNYIPHEVSEAPLVLRNNDKVPRLVKVTLENSPHFKLVRPKCVPYKVAPGLALTDHVIFTPEENKDYCPQITCVTDREQFIVPIRATGARAILDLPDQLNVSACPVKYSTQKTLLVRSVGNREAHCSISTQSPFSVDGSVGTLGIGDTVQVPLDFHPLKTGDHCGSLLVHYDPGENMNTNLYGPAVSVNIRLDKTSVPLENTCLPLWNRRSVAIHSRSAITAHCQWKAFGTQEEEDQRERRLCHRLWRQEWCNMSHLQCTLEPRTQDPLPLLSCTFPDQSAKVPGESLLSCDGIFSTEPAEGEIWPNSSAEFIVIFKPQEARVYQQVFYCDISGCESRLPLCIQGEGTGPRLRFSLEQLDMGEGFTGAAHNSEVVLCNKGLICAVFSLVPPATALGSCFTFLPSEGEILPDNPQVIQISFSSTILGRFTEEFKFSVNGSPEPMTLTISGCVTGPTFRFHVPSLCFGDVSSGFPHPLSCRLTNTSLVPMTFHLRIPGEGSGRPSVTSSAWLSNADPQSWRRGVQGCIRLTEFTAEPCSGTVRSLGSMDIQVTLCSNTVKNYELVLVVDVDGVGQEVRALLLTARCIVPQLEVLHPIVTFGRCFLNFPYQQPLTLVNKSHLPGCYRLLPQKHKQGDAVLYSSLTPSGIIKPPSSVNIPLTLGAQKLGHQSASASLAVLGKEKSPSDISLVATGEGPVVHVYPSEIDFGNIQVLEDASRTLHLSNQSVIPASFRAEVAGKRSCCRIEPSKGLIPPETEVAVTVIANLDDIEKFKDKVIVSIENSHSYNVLIQAFGIGITIVTDRPLAPELNLGPHFSLDPCCYSFNIMTKGRHIHRLYWRTEGFPPFPRRDRLPTIQTRGKGSSQNPRPASPVFKLQPLTVELMLGQTMEMTLEGFSSTPQPVKLGTGKELNLSIGFNPAYEEGWNSWEAEKTLKIQFLEHPHEEQVTIRGEVFPNLRIQTTTLNDTEHVCYIQMTNCSPLPVQYHWLFLVGDSTSHLRLTPTLKFLRKAKPPKEEGAQPERPAPAESSLGDGSVEEPVQALAAVGDSVPQPPDADDTLETEPLPEGAAELDSAAETRSSVTIRELMSFVSLELPTIGVEELFTNVTKSGVTLQKSRKVGFTYVVLSPSTATADSPQPGVPLVLPSTGYIGPGREQVLTVCYLPGVPGVFCRTFQTQVGHLEPEEMALKGEGSFPRIYLDLPRRIKGDENYEQILKEAKENLGEDSQRDEAVVAGEVTATEPPMDDSGTVLDMGLQMEMENMLLEQHALEQQKALSSFDQRARQRLLKVELPEYVLDLGHVILGDIQTHVVTVTNPGQLPASSCASGRALRGTGFSVDLDRVKNLPFCKTETLEVRFDPQSANLPVGEVNVVLPIKAEEGPMFPIRLRADVAVPSLCVSRDRLEFAAVHCGQCQEETIQLHNQLQVPCKWPITMKEPVVKADLAFEYLPLQMEETTGELVLQSSELGSSYYNLHLKATASKPEKPLNFCTTLGSSHTITTKIMNCAQQKTAYLLQTNSPDFQTEQTITAAAAGPRGSELSVAVTFEPCQLGETRAVLQLSSPLGSEYCTLQAVSWEFSLRGVPAQKSPGVAVLRSWALGENGACGKWLL